MCFQLDEHCSFALETLASVLIYALQAVSNKLMAGFVECLDNEEAEEGMDKEEGKSENLLSKNS